MAENGCSLEDCHTNLFALTDLTGLKWRRLCSQSETYLMDLLDDPVLVTYSKCIQSEILCAWRRQPHNTSNRHIDQIQIVNPKELWLFWYGEEPTTLRSLISPELYEFDHGSWEVGLSYECRTLLFKSLHNLIERCLLSQNFIRVGKWFVQLSKSTTKNDKRSVNLSISFNFFLHGESTVCASVDVHQHSPLHHLLPIHIIMASHIPCGIPVLLSPFGLSGYLTGASYAESDARSHKLLDDWRRFYSLSKDDSSHVVVGETTKSPSVVEVVVAGVKLFYPFCFVLMTNETEMELNSNLFQMTSSSSEMNDLAVKAASSAAAAATTSSISSKSTKVESNEMKNMLSQRVVEKSCQDSVMTNSLLYLNRHQPTDDSSAVQSVSWDFGEPLQKNPCICGRSKDLKSGFLNKSSSASLMFGGGKHGNKADRYRYHRSVAPYHRCSTGSTGQSKESNSHGMDFVLPKNLFAAGLKATRPDAASNMSSGQNVCTAGSGIICHGSTSMSGTGAQSNSIDSPHSAAPSPLMEPQTHNNCVDQTMPTLSPHPPMKTSERDSKDNNNKSNTNQCSVIISNSTHSKTSNENINCKISGKQDKTSTWLDKETKKLSKVELFKRPNLPLMFEDEDEEELRTNSFYEFPVDNVLESSFKLRLDADSPTSTSPSSSFSTYVGSSGGINQLSRLRGDISPHQHPHSADDPYVFSDETDSNVTKLKMREMRLSREDSYSKQSPFAAGIQLEDCYGRDFDDNGSSLDCSPSPTARATNLMRENDLIATIQDLEKLFDTDEEQDLNSTSSPATIDKDGENILNMNISTFKISATGGGGGTSDGGGVGEEGMAAIKAHCPTPKDLSRMFPTPPSADNPFSIPTSPMQGIEFTESMLKTDTPARIISSRKDCPFVYKIPQSCLFPSSKYYEPIELPAKPLPNHHFYKSSYQTIDRHFSSAPPPTHSQYLNMIEMPRGGGGGGIYQISRSRHDNIIMSGFDQSTTMFGLQQHQHQLHQLQQQQMQMHLQQQHQLQHQQQMQLHLHQQHRIPMNYDLMSPASNTSSFFLNRNLNSMESYSNTGQDMNAGLFVTIALSDSVLNLFKDENFNSCTICVCNMNIDGSDFGLYLPNQSNEEQFRCHCAFSSVVNRKYSLNAGLFYEDEADVIGNRQMRRAPGGVEVGGGGVGGGREGGGEGGVGDRNNDDVMPHEILSHIQEQLSTLYPSCVVVTSSQKQKKKTENYESLEMNDGQVACYLVIEFTRQMMIDSCQPRIDRHTSCLHKWPYVQNLPQVSCKSQDIVRLLKSLQPLLQDAIQKKRTTRLWESVYTISGPLSWKDFHLMAGRGPEETSEPKPIPRLLVGFDKEWISISPFAVRYWDKFLLEPFGETHDVTYVVVAPDNDVVCSQATLFFRELGVIYEQCRLGRHRPVSEKTKETIVRVDLKKSSTNVTSNETIDDSFKDIGLSPTAIKLRVYAETCRKWLASFLSQHLNEKKKKKEELTQQYQRFQQQQQQQVESVSSSSSLGQTLCSGSFDIQTNGPTFFADSDNVETNISKEELTMELESNNFYVENGREEENDKNSSFLVLYMIDPFNYEEKNEEIAFVGLIRCYESLLKAIPEALRSTIQLQIIPQQILTDLTVSHFLKSLSFSVYSSCHRILNPSLSGRSLTGFGTAASADKYLHLQSQQQQQNLCSQIYSPPFILAPSSMSQTFAADSWCEPVEKSGVLFCAYCLSEDQRWLLVACTDSCGQLLETSCINIDVPNRHQRKKVGVRRTGLIKLWEFMLGVMSSTIQPWRVVIGRFGRLGHGELKGWSTILSRQNLLASSKQLRKKCFMCRLGSNVVTPCVLSACLVSMELHPTLHIMIDSVKREENQSSKCQMSTPRDVTCTHILVFPTSATAQANLPVNQQENHIDFAGPEFADDILRDLEAEDIGVGIDEDDLGDIFNFSPTSPKNHSPAGSPNMTSMQDGTRQGGGGGGGETNELNKEMMEEEEEMNSHNLQQQPLAMGFYVSTAHPGPLPKWFWSSCRHKEDSCPVCFKASLHIHCPLVQQNQDDLINQSTPNKHSHSLDSSLTCDVLRYVLETYNMLSWLTIDPITSDRRSCLPSHMFILMQLYHGFNINI